MGEEKFNLEEYLAGGVEKIVKGIIKNTLKNAEASKYMLHYAKANRKAVKIRHENELKGNHIPPFLIASITNACNLHCLGCYARSAHTCFDEPIEGEKPMTAEEWSSIFDEAENIGVSFFLLAGGEPMLRRDVLEVAGRHRNILFPTFTNGTLFEKSHIDLFENNPNLLPVISIEGDQSRTDNRRGKGVYDKIQKSMDELHKRNILFGASVTVTKDNLEEVTSDAFVSELEKKGCKAIIYVEFVPTNELTKILAPDDEDRDKMNRQVGRLRETRNRMMFICFPGDEKKSGGCLAAGRGFFHINGFGAAEPCPFSPFSDVNVRETGLLGALKSPLFRSLKDGELLNADHIGGCVLYEREEQVKELCKK